jgi:hypothetical protein
MHYVLQANHFHSPLTSTLSHQACLSRRCQIASVSLGLICCCCSVCTCCMSRAAVVLLCQPLFHQQGPLGFISACTTTGVLLECTTAVLVGGVFMRDGSLLRAAAAVVATGCVWRGRVHSTSGPAYYQGTQRFELSRCSDAHSGLS